MKEFQDKDFYQPPPPLSTTMQGIEQQLKKSAQANNGTATNGLLGRFLKLGKSKSDVHTSNYVKRRSSGGSELEDDFVLAPVQLRGVEKMVHRSNTTKKDVSRSHSWIYGSVKLPSDLPVGYGYDSNNGQSRRTPSPSPLIGPSAHQNGGGQTPQDDPYSSTPPISRCQQGMSDFCTCSCNDTYYNYLNPNFLPGQGPKAPCRSCQTQLVLGSNPSGIRKLTPQQLQGLNPLDSKKFASSVRKLTWKSLKQAVKKRPSLDSIITGGSSSSASGGSKKVQPEVIGSSVVNYAADDFLYSPTTNYFFPEKKNSNFYASCTDLYGSESQHVTASVRLRPKRSRPTWNFPNEFGPVPNYATQDDSGEAMYHSEWDLRQCAMPYEQWLTSTGSGGSSTSRQGQFLDDLFSSPVSNVKIRSYSNSQNKGRVNKPSTLETKTNGGVGCNGTTTTTTSTTNGNPSTSSKSSSDLYTNGGVKRFSILHNETATAYQLNRNEEDEDEEREQESDEGSEDGSHLILNDDPVRIAGQGIFMVGGSSGNKVTRSNSTSSAKFKSASFGSSSTNKGNHPHHLLLSSNRSEADGIWSDTQVVDERPIRKGQSEQVGRPSLALTSDPNPIDPDDRNVLKTFKQPEAKVIDLQVTTASKAKEVKAQKQDDNCSKSGPKKTNGVKSSTSKRSDPENKYGALRRRRLRVSTEVRGGKTNLLRETIYEEESDEALDPGDDMHSVKILVSQSGNSSSDYVKPILKTRITNGGHDDMCDEIYDDTVSSRSPRKVQFNNSREEIVISQSSSSGSGTGESESNSEDEEEDEQEDSKRTSKNVSHFSDRHDHNGDPETKSGHKNQLAARQEIPIEKVSLPSSLQISTTTSSSSSQKQSTNSSSSFQKQSTNSSSSLQKQSSNSSYELPSYHRTRNVNFANDVNNLESLSSKQVKENPIIKTSNGVSSDAPSSSSSSTMTSKRKGSDSVTKGKSQGPIQIDEKMILSKLKRMQNSKAERITPSTGNDSQLLSGNDKDGQFQNIVNPNSLLFHDTTRIRLNQTRPSLENTFRVNDGPRAPGSIQGNGNSSVRKIRPSQSFRTITVTSGALRPKDPPPPPPRISSAPPPPPPRSTSPTTTRTNKSQISLPMPNLGFSTTNDLVSPKSKEGFTSSNSHYQNTASAIFRKHKSKSLEGKCEAIEKVLSQQQLSSSPAKSESTLTQRSAEEAKPNDSQNIEIVTRENSVSEIRIYSGPKTGKPLPAPKNPNLIQSKRDIYYSTNDLFQRPSKMAQFSSPNPTPLQASRPQSTSVVLIIDTASTDMTGNSIKPNQNLHNDQMTKVQSVPQLQYNSNNSQKQNEVIMSSVVGQEGRQDQIKRDLVYDDVISSHFSSQHQSAPHKEKYDIQNLRMASNSTLNSHLKTPVEKNSNSDVDSLQSIYSDIGMTFSINGQQQDMLYDDAVSMSSGAIKCFEEPKNVSDLPILLTQTSSSSEDSSDTLVEEEPLYDDILNVASPGPGDSDSGTETDVPPPLPASGPPVHLLPEISLDLPLIPLPTGGGKSGRGSISKGTNRLLGEIIEFSKKFSGRGSTATANGIGGTLQEEGSNFSESAKAKSTDQIISNPQASMESIINPPLFQVALPENVGSQQDESGVLDRTKTLLHELNEKLANLNFSPEDYSTYISKVIISSSSDSSGVEEDYNSEKNYSLSNDGGESGASSTASAEENYKLSKLVTETISMARGKFLDSMKITTGTGMGVGGHRMSCSQRPLSIHTGSDGDEPIYEEINDSNNSIEATGDDGGHALILRSSSPIYADAFDAKSIFDGASRNEILSFLESIRDRLAAADLNSGGNRQASLDSMKKTRKNVEIERNDSGIGSETGSSVLALPTPSGSTSLRILAICKDCNDSPVETRRHGGGSDSNVDPIGYSSHFCRSCFRKRSERKEIIQEIYETELKYGRDLRIISDEFYTPIQTAGLLSKDQLEQIFLNVDQLIEVNVILSSSLKSAITTSIQASSPDEDLNSVNVGRIFLDIGERMMSAFETYCTRQASAGALLTQIEKEKELLRIFLRVSQMENAVLRRMNLPAFLMVPVQRVTRYPLLLSRLLKVTAPEHHTREELELAQEKIEQHLEHMNKTTREVASVKLWRRISIINGAGSGGSNNNLSGTSPLHRRSNTDFDAASVRIRKMALDILDWGSLKDVSCVLESQLNMVQCNSAKTTRHIYGILLARGKDLERLALRMDQDMFFPPKDDVVKDVKLVLVRAKNARFSLLREPLCLAKCVISKGDAEFQDFIEINEITTKNTYYLQALDKQGTCLWFKLLQSHAVCVGQWRRRRGALANIMMNGMMRHL